MGGNLQAWQGPRIRWANRQDPEATIFALDDEVEDEEWRSVHSQVRAMVRAVTNVLRSLRESLFFPLRVPKMLFLYSLS